MFQAARDLDLKLRSSFHDLQGSYPKPSSSKPCMLGKSWSPKGAMRVPWLSEASTMRWSGHSCTAACLHGRAVAARAPETLNPYLGDVRLGGSPSETFRSRQHPQPPNTCCPRRGSFLTGPASGSLDAIVHHAFDFRTVGFLRQS